MTYGRPPGPVPQQAFEEKLETAIQLAVLFEQALIEGLDEISETFGVVVGHFVSDLLAIVVLIAVEAGEFAVGPVGFANGSLDAVEEYEGDTGIGAQVVGRCLRLERGCGGQRESGEEGASKDFFEGIIHRYPPSVWSRYCHPALC